MSKFRLTWKEVATGPKHDSYTAKDANGTVYWIRPVAYRKGKFAGYRITAGNVRVKGLKTMLHEAKLAAQRHANRQRQLTVKVVRSRSVGMRTVDLDIGPIEISVPSLTRPLLDLD